MDHALELLTLIFLDALLLFGVVIGVVCFAVGLLMLLAPDVVLRVSAQLGEKWFSARRALKPAEIPRRSEAAFYKHHRLSGLLLFLAGTVIGWSVLAFEPAAAVKAFGQEVGSRELVSWLVDAGLWLMALVSIAGIILGAIVFLRPSLLKAFEGWSNRWVSTRRHTRFLEQSHDPLARLFARWPRVFGVFVTLGGLYIFFVSALIMIEGS